MKRSLLTVFSVLIYLVAYAAAPVAGSITYKHLSGNTYKVTCKIARDCRGIPFSPGGIMMYCGMASDIVRITAMHKPVFFFQNLEIFPNPPEGLFSMVYDTGIPADITVYDMRGTLLESIQVKGQMLDLRHLQKGTYLIIARQDETWYKRVVVCQ